MSKNIEAIHDSLINGQRRQMVDQINKYGTYDFWKDYRDYLNDLYVNPESVLAYFSDAVISYDYIMGR